MYECLCFALVCAVLTVKKKGPKKRREREIARVQSNVKVTYAVQAIPGMCNATFSHRQTKSYKIKYQITTECLKVKYLLVQVSYKLYYVVCSLMRNNV